MGTSRDRVRFVTSAATRIGSSRHKIRLVTSAATGASDALERGLAKGDLGDLRIWTGAEGFVVFGRPTVQPRLEDTDTLECARGDGNQGAGAVRSGRLQPFETATVRGVAIRG